MTAYVDTSALVSVFFGEPGSEPVRKRLAAQTELVSSPLLVAEFLAALRREGRPLAEARPVLSTLSLAFLQRSLQPECEEVLGHAYLRGADLWHLATALAVVGTAPRRKLLFLSLDQPQLACARKLGFGT